MSDRGLSIFDDEPEEAEEVTGELTGEPVADAGVERTQVLPSAPAAPPEQAQQTQRRPVLPPPAPSGSVAEAAQVHARQTTARPASPLASGTLPTVRRGGYD